MNFDLSIINEMIIPVIVIFSLVVGYIMKKWLPVDNKIIPTVLTICGGILGGFISGWNIESITAGMLSGLASTGLHQLFYQYLKIDDATTIMGEVDYMGPGKTAEEEKQEIAEAFGVEVKETETITIEDDEEEESNE